jgi:heme-degrading monooxygenase HmoA
VIHIDGYGNVVTNITRSNFNELVKAHTFKITFGRSMHDIHAISATYGDVPAGERVAFFGATGFLEIAVNKGVAGGGGGAAQLLGLRVVKMTFRPEEVATFQHLFEGWRQRIITFPGCRHLELLHDLDDPRVFFTYSVWDRPDDLEAYRKSDVFAGVWPVVKGLFAARADAWTVHREHTMDSER